MDKQRLLQVLLDQQEELDSLVSDDYVQRPEAKQFEFNSKLAQVVIGVRRSGKSTLCHMALRNKGVKYGYVNFDDDRLYKLAVDDLNDILETLYIIYGTDVKYLFFDEIQNVDGWHLFVNRLLRLGLHVFVTGSNAKLLSTELATHLTGRYNEIRLYPFSFSEYCKARHVVTDKATTKNIAAQQAALYEYLMEGGFPELDGISNRHAYVEGIVNTIITKDIKARFKLRNEEGIKVLANHFINNVGQLTNVKDITENLGIGTAKTVRNYMDYLTQAFLILPISKFSYKSSVRIRGDKVYIIDTGLMTYRHNSLSSENLGWRLENVVMTELLRRTNPSYQDIYYYRSGSTSREVDFVVTDHSKPMELIQVSFDISNPKTLRRELMALADASRKLHCDNLTLVAMSQTRTEKLDGVKINVISAHEWLLTAPAC